MRTLAALALAVLALVVGGCASAPSPAIDAAGATVLDVRTPDEYAEGHLEGAVNLDVLDQEVFLAAVADLDPDGAYVVYCRSGRRSAAAVEQLTNLGFTDLVDAGGLDEAAEATDIPIVTP